jgi:lysophospholipid acyltransferase (LPLAT)-like uncharacterized protein
MSEPPQESSRRRRRRRKSQVARGLEALLAPLAALLLRALGATWRVRIRHGAAFPGPPAPELLAFWHQDVLLAAILWRDSGAVVPVSQSRDGDRIAALMRHLGLGEPPRGSSSRGGSQALRSLVKQARAGAFVAVMVDGPRGPARVVKPGILATAQLSRRSIRPVALRARPHLRARSWDGTRVAPPFARIDVAVGEPLVVPSIRSPEQRESLLRELAARLDALHTELEGGTTARRLGEPRADTGALPPSSPV